MSPTSYQAAPPRSINIIISRETAFVKPSKVKMVMVDEKTENPISVKA